MPGDNSHVIKRDAEELFGLIPAELASTHHLVPISATAATLDIGVAAVPDDSLLRELAFLTGKKINPVIRDQVEIRELISRHYSDSPDRSERPARKVSVHVGGRSVIQMVDGFISRAIEAGASDIHVEPYESSLRLRYRLDGVLQSVDELPADRKDEITARLKIMAGLDIAERRRPQDGRIRVERVGGGIDVRVSTLPTQFGEKVVLRILDKSGLNLDLSALGLSDDQLACLTRCIRLPIGMVLVTGPTGSGKTTTLYAALNARNTPEVNVTTIEDPIEYNLPGINQTHVRSDIGFTFAQALRSFLRQDPDIIMVGEIRDGETAEIAVRAALTGHLVMSTLHTNDAPSTITRLMDMGLEPFLVAASVRLVVAQRLVRRICTNCKQESIPDARILFELQIENRDGTLCRGAGCELCNGTGFKGRVAVFEFMPVTERVSEMISARTGTHRIRECAREEGMRTLREAGIALVQAGVTTADEVLRETN